MKNFVLVKMTLIIDGEDVDQCQRMMWKLMDGVPSPYIRDYSQEPSDYMGPWDIEYSLFRHRKYLEPDCFGKRYYLDKHHIQIRFEYVESDNFTLEGMIKNARVEDAIEYLKERGIKPVIEEKHDEVY